MRSRSLVRGTKVVLVGYSMGGAIVTAFAAANPSRVQGLGLIAPAGLVDEPKDIPYRLLKIPILGEYAFRLMVGWVMTSAATHAPPRTTMRIPVPMSTCPAPYVPVPLPTYTLTNTHVTMHIATRSIPS